MLLLFWHNKWDATLNYLKNNYPTELDSYFQQLFPVILLHPNWSTINCYQCFSTTREGCVDVYIELQDYIFSLLGKGRQVLGEKTFITTFFFSSLRRLTCMFACSVAEEIMKTNCYYAMDVMTAITPFAWFLLYLMYLKVIGGVQSVLQRYGWRTTWAFYVWLWSRKHQKSCSSSLIVVPSE